MNEYGTRNLVILRRGLGNRENNGGIKPNQGTLYA
jgi:hypothetical protein